MFAFSPKSKRKEQSFVQIVLKPGDVRRLLDQWRNSKNALVAENSYTTTVKS